MADDKASEQPSAGVILVAFEKLFGGGRGVKKFAHSGLLYVELGENTVLVEQNPRKKSKWATMVKEDHRVAWVMSEGKFLARVIDGEVLMLNPQEPDKREK
jgi:hypothetical protein